MDFKDEYRDYKATDDVDKTAPVFSQRGHHSHHLNPQSLTHYLPIPHQHILILFMFNTILSLLVLLWMWQSFQLNLLPQNIAHFVSKLFAMYCSNSQHGFIILHQAWVRFNNNGSCQGLSISLPWIQSRWEPFAFLPSIEDPPLPIVENVPETFPIELEALQ